MLESLINLKLAMKHNKPKSVVYERYQNYTDAYEKMNEHTIRDKAENREIYFDYIRYMSKLGESL